MAKSKACFEVWVEGICREPTPENDWVKFYYQVFDRNGNLVKKKNIRLECGDKLTFNSEEENLDVMELDNIIAKAKEIIMFADFIIDRNISRNISGKK